MGQDRLSGAEVPVNHGFSVQFENDGGAAGIRTLDTP
jgi:hypothetical protein